MGPVEPIPTERKRSKRWALVGGLLGAGIAGWIGISWAALPDVTPLADKNPETTALIEARGREALAAGKKARRRQHWVQLSAIAPIAVQAVLVSEDARFWQHEGIDTVELEKAMEEAWASGELGRGASTITQQLAKNLWLSEDRSLLRKGKEFVLARRLEDALPKKRILAIYLNVVEWGPGVYGIDAAAREHFGVPAAALSPAQGAILAGMLPAPRRWIPATRPPALRRRALRIVDRLQAAGRLGAAQADQARQEIEARLGKRQVAPAVPGASAAPAHGPAAPAPGAAPAGDAEAPSAAPSPTADAAASP